MLVNVEFMNPFITAACGVLEEEVGATIKKGRLSLEEGDFLSQEVTVLLGVTGKVEGQVFYGMKEKTAKKIVSAMMGEELLVFDDFAQSGISELGNVITGKAGMGLESAGYPCNLSPPTLILREGTCISTLDIKRILVPLITQYGEIIVHVGLTETDDDD